MAQSNKPDDFWKALEDNPNAGAAVSDSSGGVDWNALANDPFAGSQPTGDDYLSGKVSGGTEGTTAKHFPGQGAIESAKEFGAGMWDLGKLFYQYGSGDFPSVKKHLSDIWQNDKAARQAVLEDPRVDIWQEQGSPTSTYGAESRPLLEASQWLMGHTPLVGPWLWNRATQVEESPAFGSEKLATDLLLGEAVGAFGRRGMIPKAEAALSEASHEGALTSMGRALDPTGQINKYVAGKSLQRLVDEQIAFTGPKALIEDFTKRGSEAMNRKANIRAQWGENPQVPGRYVMNALESARQRLRRVGGKTTGDVQASRTIGEINNLELEIRRAMLAERNPAFPQNLLDQPISEFSKSEWGRMLPPLDEAATISFDTLEHLKQVWQDNAKSHGYYSGKERYGMSWEGEPSIRAEAGLANEMRGVLDAVSEELTGNNSWTQANRDYSFARDVLQVAKSRQRANQGIFPPHSEEVIGGLGSKMGWTGGRGRLGLLTGAEIRGFRRLRGSPLYQSLMSVGREQLGKILGRESFGPYELIPPIPPSQPFNAYAFWTGKQSDQPVSPGATANLETGDVFTPRAEASPAVEPGTKVTLPQRKRWNPETGQLEPIQ